MFLSHLAEISRTPKENHWLIRLSLVPLVVVYEMLSQIFGWSTSWVVFLIIAGEALLLFLVDRIVKARLLLEFRKQFNPFTNPFSPLPKLITQTEVDTFLEAVAWKLKYLTEEQRRAAESNRTFPNGFTHAGMRVINEWVASALKYYWRAHWLAKLFGFEVKKSWKDYLPTAQAA